LEWIAENIHLFGGDSTRVTVIGESAGGMSIIHHITAYGGRRGPALFQQAIIQSGGWVPVITKKQQKDTLDQFLGLLNVTSIEDARKLPSEKLIAANAFQAYYSTWASFTYGPVVDGDYVPDFPWRLLLEDKFDHDVSVMIGHNSDEGLLFTSPDSRNSDFFEDSLLAEAPVSLNDADHISNVLYPPIYDGSYGYTDPVQRVALFIGEWALNCNLNYLRRAYKGNTHAYQFSIPPGLHGQDVPYTFYKDGSTLTSILFDIPVSNVTVALAMQDWFTSFAFDGEPRSDLGPDFIQHGPHARLMDIGQETLKMINDSTDNPRCRFWQTVPYLE
jgi:carboxylesterase type B